MAYGRVALSLVTRCLIACGLQPRGVDPRGFSTCGCAALGVHPRGLGLRRISAGNIRALGLLLRSRLPDGCLSLSVLPCQRLKGIGTACDLLTFGVHPRLLEPCCLLSVSITARRLLQDGLLQGGLLQGGRLPRGCLSGSLFPCSLQALSLLAHCLLLRSRLLRSNLSRRFLLGSSLPYRLSAGGFPLQRLGLRHGLACGHLPFRLLTQCCCGRCRPKGQPGLRIGLTRRFLTRRFLTYSLLQRRRRRLPRSVERRQPISPILCLSIEPSLRCGVAGD